MRSLALILLLPFSILACTDGEETFDSGTSGGAGTIVSFGFDCDSTGIDCPGAEKISNPLADNGREVKCAWSCALNNTDFKDYRFEDLTEPARHVITFRKMGDNCWFVYAVNTDKCGEKL